MFDVAAGRDGLVAIGYAARPRMQATAWFSNDGSTWERAPLGDTGASRVNAVAWDGTSWVIVGEDRGDWDGTLEGLATASARAAAWTSPDGGTWTRVPDAPALEVGGFIDTLEDPTTGGMSDVVAGPGGIVAVGSVCHPRPAGCVPAAWTSPDGTTWQRSIGVPAIPGVLGTVATSGSGYVAAGPSLILASPDGRAWVRQPFDGPDLGTVTWMGDRYFATAVAGPRIAWASTDGSAWAAADVRGGPTADGTSVGDVWRLGATPQTAIWFGMSSDTGDPEAWVSGAGAGP